MRLVPTLFAALVLGVSINRPLAADDTPKSGNTQPAPASTARNDDDASNKFVPQSAPSQSRGTRLLLGLSPFDSSVKWIPAGHPRMGDEEPEKIHKLRVDYRQWNERALAKAAEFRQVKSSNPSLEDAKSATLERVKIEVQEAVLNAYRVREELQVAEIDWLRQRLARIEGQLKEREQLKQQIVDRRIAELLNPGLQWEPAPVSASEQTTTRVVPADDTTSIQKKHDTRNNLKRLTLAMHSFHDSYSHFPKAVATARDFGHQTDTPHSWRIDLLPFLGAADLYQQYNMDEPWDGPNNKKLLDRMPAVFRSPYDDPKSTNTSYFALVGKGTVFEPGKVGVKISDIYDGTSNTILLVEQKQATPWTKPEDIPFDAAEPTPRLGGFVDGKFAAALADGAAFVFDRAKVSDILPWMIVRNDGHAIRIPSED